MAAMFGVGIGRDSTVVGLSENGSGICRGGGYWTKDVGRGGLFSQRFI